MPPWSSGRPGDEPGAHSPSIWPCSGWGLAAAASPQPAGRSYRPISPLPTTRKPLAVCFCATFRPPRRTNPSAIAWALPSTLPGGARTFLPLRRNDAKGGHPVRTALRRQSSIGPYRGQMKHPPAPGQSRLEFWMPCNPSFRRKPESRGFCAGRVSYGPERLDSGFRRNDVSQAENKPLSAQIDNTSAHASSQRKWGAKIPAPLNSHNPMNRMIAG